MSNKFGARRTQLHGIIFDSAAEAARYQQLLLLQRAGEITALELQPKFPLVIDGIPVLIPSGRYQTGRAAFYKADFRYRERSGALIVEDVKGMDTAVSKLKRALVAHPAIHGQTVRLIHV